MPRLQLTMVITTAVVLFVAGGYALWHTWQEQELEYEEIDATIESMRPKDRGKAPVATNEAPHLTVYLRSTPVRSTNPYNVDPELRGGRWITHLYDDAATAGRAHALTSLRRSLEGQLQEAGVKPADARGRILKGPDVGDADVLAVFNVFLEMGIVDVELPRSDEGLTSKERAANAAGR